MTCSPNDMSQKTRFRAMHSKCMCFLLIEDGRSVAITAVVHVDDIFAVGQKER